MKGIQIIKPLARAEEAHARLICRFWKSPIENPQPFEELSGNLKGDILEGGANLNDTISKVESIKEDYCINLLKRALEVEFRAYALYRTMANMTSDADATPAFISIAQAEKNHVQLLAEAITECPELKK